ncbi:MAG: hypothetical protein N2746_03205 [Deltaproteobacteria bacterium]|nr:hypothetical protein [Deltaproteobacteria bacterium]
MIRRMFLAISIMVGLCVISCSDCERKKLDIKSIIPQDTQNVVLIPNVNSLINGVVQFLKQYENGLAFETLKKEIDLVSQKLGVNLMDRKSIIEAGFNPDGSIAIISTSVMLEGKQQNVNLVLMPYSDRSKAENTLNRLARDREKTEIFKTKSYMNAKIITAIRQGPKGEKPVLMYAFYKGFVIYGLPEKAEAAIRKIIDTREINSLAKNEVFNGLKDRIRSGQIYFFINSGKNIEPAGLNLSREMKRMVSSIRDNFHGMLLSLDISQNGVSLDSFTGLSQNSLGNLNRYLSKSSTDEIERLMYIVPEDPFFLLKVSMNFTEIYNFLKSENPYQMMIINKRIFGPMMKYMEVDVEKDILPLIKGSLIYAVSPSEQYDINKVIESGFRGEAFNKLFNVFYSMNLNDEKLSNELLERFSKSMIEKGQRVERINLRGLSITSSRFGAAHNSYWFVDKNNFYAFYTENKPENVVRKPEEKSRRPTYKIPQDVLKTIMDNPSSQVIYISFSPIRKMIEKIDEKSFESISSTGIYKFSFMLIKEFLGKLDNLAIYSIPQNDGVAFSIFVNMKGK